MTRTSFGLRQRLRVAIWAASYFGWIPAMQILPPLHRQPANRRLLMIVAHLVWGAGTVWIGEYMANRRDILSRQRLH